MDKKRIAALGLAAYVLSAATAFGIMSGDKSIDFNISEEQIGKLCVASVFPSITRGTDRQESGESSSPVPPDGTAQESAGSEDITGGQTEGQAGILDTQDAENPTPATPNIDTKKPLVIIYHTHATESYQPYAEGNFHVLAETGTVREVGNVLAAELEAMGIGVIHDTTIHDNPSYNESYTRSMETLQGLMSTYPGAVYIVDLHRDAAAYYKNTANTVIVNGETAAKYSLVVGQGNANLNALTIFANTVNNKAEELYPGFSGRIIEKTYRFNQYMSDYYLLLEVGNNENNIKEAKVTGKYFAHVLAGVINDAVN